MTHILPSRTMVRVPVRILLTLGLASTIAACSETGELAFGTRDAAAPGPAPISAAPASEREVEAPDVFDLADEGLWDGRPSLGGVWVAHAEALDPERVIIRNEDTGTFVIGALFRRERELPGPSIQVSSEAAAALGILAGNPTNLKITALRMEAAPETPEMPIAEEPEVVADATVAPASEAEDAQALATAAAAAIDAAPASTAAPTPAPLAEATEPAATGLAALFRPFTAAQPAPEPVPEPARNMSAEDIATGIQTVAFSTSSIPTTRPVDPVTTAAEAAIAESEIAVEALPVAAPAPAASPEATPLPAAIRVPEPARATVAAAPRSADTLDRPFVQIGVFSVQENAENTGEALRNAGLVPTIHDQTSNGRQLWRVVVGPAPTPEDRSAVLETVRGLGFGDAYFVAR